MADVTQPWGLVHGRINVAVGDSTDAGRAPDKVPVSSGTASFSLPGVEKLVVKTPGVESMDLPQKIDAPIVNGVIQWGGTDDVSLIASPGWRVDFSGLKYVDPNTGLTKTVSMTGWQFDVKPYVEGYVDPATGTNTTITQLTDSVPVAVVNGAAVAKGDTGPAPTLITRNTTTTTDPAQAKTTYIPVPNTPGSYYVDTVQLVSTGGSGGGTGTVTKVNGVAPDGSGVVTLAPADIGAASATAVSTAQTTASNALSAANAAGSAANTAQTTANGVQTALPSKADASALAGYAPLAGATFTGTVKAPTPATATNDTTVATMAAVRAAITAYAPAGGGASNLVLWDATTQKWTQNGAQITVRPTVTGPLMFLSTNDPLATRPAFWAAGDSWVQHPDGAS